MNTYSKYSVILFINDMSTYFINYYFIIGFENIITLNQLVISFFFLSVIIILFKLVIKILNLYSVLQIVLLGHQYITIVI